MQKTNFKRFKDLQTGISGIALAFKCDRVLGLGGFFMVFVSCWRSLKAIAIFLFLIQPGSAVADDVYNFYFQKAPGPTTVIQGGGQPRSDAPQVVKLGNQSLAPEKPVAGIPAGTQSLAATEASVEVNRTKWALELGYANQNIFQEFKGYGLSLSYNFARTLGIRLGVTYTTYSHDSWKDPSQVYNSFDQNAALTFTPFRIASGDYDVFALGISGGAFSTLKDLSSNEKVVRPCVGAIAEINFSRNFGLLAEYKRSLAASTKSEYEQEKKGPDSQFQANVAFRF